MFYGWITFYKFPKIIYSDQVIGHATARSWFRLFNGHYTMAFIYAHALFSIRSFFVRKTRTYADYHLKIIPFLGTSWFRCFLHELRLLNIRKFTCDLLLYSNISVPRAPPRGNGKIDAQVIVLLELLLVTGVNLLRFPSFVDKRV